MIGETLWILIIQKRPNTNSLLQIAPWSVYVLGHSIPIGQSMNTSLVNEILCNPANGMVLNERLVLLCYYYLKI